MAVEIEEDQYFDKVASRRLAENKKSISHKEAWK